MDPNTRPTLDPSTDPSSGPRSGPNTGAVSGPDLPSVVIQVPTSATSLAALTPHPGLDTFRPPRAQLASLVAIAQEPTGCVATAILASEDQLVGYAAFHRPSGIETWSDDRSGRLMELGAVEVAPGMRGLKLAERLLAAAFADGRFDDTVVFATLYRWHYDLERTGLGELGYRRMLERLYASVGLLPMPTNDIEVGSDHANRLVARIGHAAPPEVVEEFQRLRLRRW
ncbi:MAG TPA: GNAT family N-acetyltransferase [Trueperaceae bacterium]|nr:GNAT family N-acetyltransferase [Trueperaceae bacterium]